MSDLNSPKNSLIETTINALPIEEQDALLSYVESGKPPLSRVRSDALSTIYNLGHSCTDITRMFPEYSLGLIVHAKVSNQWDNSKEELSSMIKESSINQAEAVKIDSIRFLSELLTATHVKWRKDVLRYLANPDREKAPDCLPNSLSSYKDTVRALDEFAMLNPDAANKTKGASMPIGNLTQLISVNVDNNKEKSIDIKEVKDNRAATLLRQRSKEIKNGQK